MAVAAGHFACASDVGAFGPRTANRAGIMKGMSRTEGWSPRSSRQDKYSFQVQGAREQFRDLRSEVRTQPW